MLERFKRYFTELESLSCDELDRSAEKLVCAEKQSVAKLIAHLAEMSRRKAALELGYKHLFDYCLTRLHLSEGSIPLRIQVANGARAYPQLLVALAENRISLTVAGLLAGHVNDTNVDQLLPECAGMTKRQAEEYLVSLRPKPVFMPSIRKHPKPPKGRPDPAPAYSSEPRAEALLPRAPERPPTPKPKPMVEPAEPDLFNFRFAADQNFKAKFERLAEVLGVENAQKHMAQIFDQALDLALAKKDPKRKHERRQARVAAKSSPSPDEVTPSTPATSRYVSSEVRERIFAKAGYQCEYQARDGTRCRSRTGLQIEHEQPFAIHHSHDETHLLAFCAGHNRFAAERIYGTAFIQRKIDENRRDVARTP